jgi:hypothetical protein
MDSTKHCVVQPERHAGACVATGNGLGRKVWVASGIERDVDGLWIIYRCKDTNCPASLRVDADEALKLSLAEHDVPMPREREGLRIVAAAIRAADGRIFSMPAPARHHDINRMMHEQGVENMGEEVTQGFLLSNGRFCRRKPARHIAEKAGQLIERASKLDWLSSEDVW